MKFSPSKAARVSSEGSPSTKKGKSNITTEKHHMKVKVFQVLWDRVNSTTELVTVQNVLSKDLTSGLKGESNRLIEVYLTRVFAGEATKYSYDQPLLYPCDTHMAPSVFIDRIERLGVDLPSLYANMIPIKSSKADLMKKASDRGEPINITRDFLVAFLAYGNPDHSERGSQRLNKIVTYYQTMLRGMVDAILAHSAMHNNAVVISEQRFILHKMCPFGVEGLHSFEVAPLIFDFQHKIPKVFIIFPQCLWQ